MEGQNSIKKNMFMNIVLTMSNFVFPLITFSYVAKVLMPEGTGKVAFAQSVLSYFSYIAILGIPAYGLRECAKVRDDKIKLSHTVQELLIINLISTFFSYLCLIIAVFSVPRLYTDKTLLFIMSVEFVLRTIGVEWLYQALEEYTYITVRSLIFKLISVVLTFIIIRDITDYIWYGGLTVFAASASYVCNFFRIKKYISFRKNGSYDLKHHLKPIGMLFSASIIISVYANFDVLMIGIIQNNEAVGLYNVALKIKIIILAISTAISNVLIPRVAYYSENGEIEKINRLLVKSLRLSLVFTIPIALFVFMFSGEVIELLCGMDYLDAIPTLRILMICIIPLTLTSLLGQQLLIPIGHEKQYSQSVFIGMWINLIINFLLIPRLGAFGAAIGTLLTECWNVFWMGRGVKGHINYMTKHIKLRKYISGLVLGIVFSIILKNKIDGSNIFVQIFLLGTVFLGAYYVLLLILKEPILVEGVKFMRNLRKQK